MIRSIVACCSALSLVAVATAARAQDPAPTTGTGAASGGTVSAGGSASTSVGAAGSSTSTAAATPPAPEPPSTKTTAATDMRVDSAETDHDLFVGRFAVGYLGVTQLPIANPGGASAAGALLTRDNVNAPIIGVRYWINRTVGLDVGLGLGYTGGSTEAVTPTSDTTTDKSSRFGGALHAGVPLALAHAKHYSFEVIPEATIGLVTGTNKGGAGTADTDVSGFRFDLGARVGAEIYFGFIGVPQLSLQASVGAFVRREAIKAKQGPNSASDGTTTFGTSVQSDPWALFVNNVSAFYYF